MVDRVSGSNKTGTAEGASNSGELKDLSHAAALKIGLGAVYEIRLAGFSKIDEASKEIFAKYLTTIVEHLADSIEKAWANNPKFKSKEEVTDFTSLLKMGIYEQLTNIALYGILNLTSKQAEAYKLKTPEGVDFAERRLNEPEVQARVAKIGWTVNSNELKIYFDNATPFPAFLQNWDNARSGSRNQGSAIHGMGMLILSGLFKDQPEVRDNGRIIKLTKQITSAA